MELRNEKIDWIFWFLCLLVGIVAEEAFFQDQIGVSYFVFIAMFYTLFFYRFLAFPFSHQRIGYFILIAIWLLAIGYFLYDITLFYVLNILIIPGLVIFHLSLITSPKKMEWSSLRFIWFTFFRLIYGLLYNITFTKYIARLFMESNNKKHYDVWKKILIGIAISVPILFIILNLLISADSQFERLLNHIPNLISIRVDYVFRFIIILLYTFGFFGFMQVLLINAPFVQKKDSLKPVSVDGIIALTMLLLLNLVYVLFIAVQFKYFFSGTLDDGYTYAQYARRGFFELLFVTLINLTVTTTVIPLTKNVLGYLKSAIRVSLTVLVLSSGVLLISAFMRMGMYEDAYGFTFTRVLVHSFMIFLMVIFAYTLVKIWIEKVSLFHFYFIASLIYYVSLNIINFDQMIVKRNIERFEETGNIDIHYLNELSATGILGLIELYEKNPEIPGLKELLIKRKENREHLKADSWQSHNFTRNKAYEELGELDL